jgi:UDP-glucose 4-epimerase
MDHFQEFYNNKRVLVTGGAGFIGSHLVEKLVTLGAKVTVLDNFSTGTLANIKSVAHSVSLYYADVRSSYSCLKATANQEIVFHCAAFISVPESLKHPETCTDVNVNGTECLLNACLKNGVKSFVFSSSSAVYGNKNDFCSETDPLAPETPYAHSKCGAEALCQKIAKESCMKIAILRYFNVYGDRQNPHGPYGAVVARFKEQIRTGKPITIFGDGHQTRDFVPVADVVNANLNTAMKQYASGNIFNIGSGESINLFELVEQLKKELKISKTEFSFFPARQGDIIHSKANCEKYKKLAVL